MDDCLIGKIGNEHELSNDRINESSNHRIIESSKLDWGKR